MLKVWTFPRQLVGSTYTTEIFRHRVAKFRPFIGNRIQIFSSCERIAETETAALAGEGDPFFLQIKCKLIVATDAFRLDTGVIRSPSKASLPFARCLAWTSAEGMRCQCTRITSNNRKKWTKLPSRQFKDWITGLSDNLHPSSKRSSVFAPSIHKLQKHYKSKLTHPKICML